jgi:hypothetical protein
MTLAIRALREKRPTNAKYIDSMPNSQSTTNILDENRSRRTEFTNENTNKTMACAINPD